MKTSIQNLKLLLAGITVTGMLLYSSNTIAGGDGKPEGKPWPCPEKNAKMTSPMKSDAAVLTEGREIWNQHCKSCHGKTGKGDGTKAESIEITCGDFSSDTYQKKPDGEIFWKTTEGRKPMPSFKQKLTDNERWSVTLYTRTFSKKMETSEVIKSK
jgi:mono/diheme cytochrome c family protein